MRKSRCCQVPELKAGRTVLPAYPYTTAGSLGESQGAPPCTSTFASKASDDEDLDQGARLASPPELSPQSLPKTLPRNFWHKVTPP